jgi:hypothetical protein
LICAQFASAQTSANVNAYGRANIVSAITITKNHDLLFGQVVSDINAGTVVVGTDGTRTSTGGLTLLAQSGVSYSTVHQASFAITGSAGYIYTIGLPTTAVTLTSGTGEAAPTMTVDTFLSSPSGTGTLDTTLGTSTLNVGGTLHVAAGQAAGAYSGSFTVTVAYQ